MTLTRIDALKEAYFIWLAAQVKKPGRVEQRYSDLLRLMYQKEFIWLVANDENRMVDGMDLRVEFLHERHFRRDWSKEHFGPCSVLEVMIGIARRLSFAEDGAPEHWAYHLLHNLKLAGMTDPLSKTQTYRVNKALDNLVWRTYEADGNGGFFPLKYPPENQTHTEIWYQMGAYINEMHSH